MNKKALICKHDDYDFYTIPLSVKTLLHKQKNHFISSQLEKLHPCFSDSCSFDSHLKLARSGLNAEVVVMQKCTLAQFKAQKKQIYIEECKHIQFFAGNKKQLLPALIAAVFSLILIIAMSHQTRIKNDQKNLVTQEQQPELEATITTQPFFTPSLLNHIAELNGTILNFSWTYDGYNESSSFTVKGIFPEQLQSNVSKINFSPVTFEQSIPEFSINYSSIVHQQQSLSELSPTDYRSELRQIILQNELEPAEETVSPFGIKLLIPVNKIKVLEQVFDYLKQHDLSLNSIKINFDNSNIKTEIIVSQFFFPNEYDLFDSVIRTLSVFAHNANQGQGKEQQQPPVQLIKLGQIKKPDGSVTIFYKDENGKIIKR